MVKYRASSCSNLNNSNSILVCSVFSDSLIPVIRRVGIEFVIRRREEVIF
jgi:hypothetical protein